VSQHDIMYGIFNLKY